MDSSQFLPSITSFFPMFAAIYLIAYFIVFRNWGLKIRPEASSCLISLAHGPAAVFLAAHALFSDPDPGRSLASPNTPAQSSVLEYSIAYFITDLIHYLVFYPKDVLFIGHHLATLFVFATCRFTVHHGARAILTLLVLAEVTSLCQNVWTLAGVRRSDSDIARKVFDVLSPPFYCFYSVIRGLAGPLFVFKMGNSYITGGAEGLIPKWVWVSWMLVVVIAISVSILWISNLWVELYRERRTKLAKKLG